MEELPLQLSALRALGVAIAAQGPDLNYAAPQRLIASGLTDLLIRHKREIHEILRSEAPLPVVFEASVVERRYLEREKVGPAARTCASWTISIRVDEAGFRRSVARILDLWPILSARYFQAFDRTWFHLPANSAIETRYVDCRSLTAGQVEERSQALRREMAEFPLAATEGRLCAIAACVSRGKTELMISVHMIAGDGHSLTALATELITGLDPNRNSVRTGTRESLVESLTAKPKLPEPRRLLAFVDHLRVAAKGSTVGSVPLAVSPVRDPSPRMGSRRYQLGADFGPTLERQARESSTSVFTLLLSAYAVALEHVLPDWSRFVYFAISARPDKHAMQSQRVFLNRLPVYVPRLSPEARIRRAGMADLINAVREFEDIPIDLALDELKKNALHRVPDMFEFCMNYLIFSSRDASALAPVLLDADMLPGPSNTKLKLYIWNSSNGLVVRSVYRLDAICDARADEIVSAFLNDLSGS